MQGQGQVDWELLTYTRVRVLRELADFKKEREIARELGVAYATVRSHVAHLKSLTGRSDIREMARWWRERGCAEWLEWCGSQGRREREGED